MVGVWNDFRFFTSLRCVQNDRRGLLGMTEGGC